MGLIEECECHAGVKHRIGSIYRIVSIIPERASVRAHSLKNDSGDCAKQPTTIARKKGREGKLES